MGNFYAQVKNIDTGEIVKELGPMSETKAVSVANGIDINLSDDFYTEVVEKALPNVKLTEQANAELGKEL